MTPAYTANRAAGMGASGRVWSVAIRKWGGACPKCGRVIIRLWTGIATFTSEDMVMSPSRLSTILLCAVVLAAPCTAAADLPPDLALVPADAAGFLHLRFGDAWRSEYFKDFRDLIVRAGPKAVDAISKRFTPDPMTFDRLTVCLLMP